MELIHNVMESVLGFTGQRYNGNPFCFRNSHV
jgi:hypothetical protein